MEKTWKMEKKTQDIFYFSIVKIVYCMMDTPGAATLDLKSQIQCINTDARETKVYIALVDGFAVVTAVCGC